MNNCHPNKFKLKKKKRKKLTGKKQARKNIPGRQKYMIPGQKLENKVSLRNWKEFSG